MTYPPPTPVRLGLVNSRTGGKSPVFMRFFVFLNWNHQSLKVRKNRGIRWGICGGISEKKIYISPEKTMNIKNERSDINGKNGSKFEVVYGCTAT